MTIRRATLDDLDALVQLRITFLRDLGAVKTDEAATMVGVAVRDYLLDKLPAGEFFAWIVEIDDRLVGTGWLNITRRPPGVGNPGGYEGYISNMYTDPDYRGRGSTTRVLQEIVAHARAAGVGRIWLHATDLGRPIYEKAGFRPNGREMELL